MIVNLREIPGNLPKDLCEHLIQKFEESDDVAPGVSGNRNVDTSVKQSMDLRINERDWVDECNFINERLFYAVDPMMREHHELLRLNFPNGCLSHSGFQIQKTQPGETGYIWHSDELYHYEKFGDKQVPMRRYITYLWYLNDGHGGNTEFFDRVVEPECGKLILFWADPSMIHRGIPPTNGNKYIMTGWVSTEMMYHENQPVFNPST